MNNKLGIAGTTAVAKVKDVGSTSSGFSRNDLVLVVGSGLWCDVANVPATNAFKIGDLSDKDAAMLPSALSAWGMLNNFVNLSKENIVVHTLGGSSTGIAISQLGAAMGLQVFSPSKTDLTNVRYHETVRSAGPCKLAISARNNKISTMVVKSLTENGVMVLCNDTLDSFDAINGITIPVGSFIFNNNALAGFNLHSWMNSDPATFRSAIVDCVTLINQKVIEIPGQVYSIKDYKKAFNDSYDGKSTIIKI